MQGSRKAKVGVFIGVLVLLFLFFGPKGTSNSPRLVRATPTPTDESQLLSTKEVTGDFMTKYVSEIEKLRVLNEQNQAELHTIRERAEQSEKTTAEIIKRMLEKMQDSEASGPAGSSEPLELSGDPYAEEAEDEKLETFGNLENPEVAPPAEPPVKPVAFIGAGDSVKVRLLAGVNAPTDGTPYPVVFELSSDVMGPDGSTLPLGGARLIAAAQGSLVDSRALFRLTSLNIQLPSGERKVHEVDGWIVGEDGIRGMSGILIDPIGKALAGAAAAGAVQGVGQGLARSNQQVIANPAGGFSVITDGDLGAFAAGQAANSAANEWSGIIRNRLNALVPVVQVLSGREASAVFAKNLSIEGLMEELDTEDYQYASLD
jgi:hypothetical protein